MAKFLQVVFEGGEQTCDACPHVGEDTDGDPCCTLFGESLDFADDSDGDDDDYVRCEECREAEFED